MSTAPVSTPLNTPTPLGRVDGFSVGLDGVPRGHDGAEGRVAAAVHYACRVAAQLEGPLAAGPLLRARTRGAYDVDAAVSWGLGGECLVRGSVRPAAPPPPLLPVAVPAAFATAQVETTFAEAHRRSGATWSALVRHDLVALRTAGDLDTATAPVLASRTFGILHGLGAESLRVVTLDHAAGTLVLVPVATHALCQWVVEYDEPVALEVAERVRTLLGGVELDGVEPGGVEPGGVAVAADDGWHDDRPLVGARFAGAVRPPREPRAPRTGGRRRWRADA